MIVFITYDQGYKRYKCHKKSQSIAGLIRDVSSKGHHVQVWDEV